MGTTWRTQIHTVLEDRQHPLHDGVNGVILLLVLLSSVIFIAQTFPLPGPWPEILRLGDGAILAIFTLEYLLRLVCSPQPLGYALSPFGILDLLALSPLLSLGFANFQLLRWLRLLRNLRFIELEIQSLRLDRNGLVLARIGLTVFTIFLVYAGLIYQVEHDLVPPTFATFNDAFYFTVVAMTTVGFGDQVPLSAAGKGVTVLMILTGVMLLPWQIGELLRQLLRTLRPTSWICSRCGCDRHEEDAIFCRRCGERLPRSLPP